MRGTLEFRAARSFLEPAPGGQATLDGFETLSPTGSGRNIPWIASMIIDRLSREHRNIERLLAILERELEVFDCRGRPDYQVIRATISYFKVYPTIYHHPQEDLVFAQLRIRDPAAAAMVGDLGREHHEGAERLRRVAQAVDSALADRAIRRKDVAAVVREFIDHERRHIMREDRDFFPAARKALQPQDWIKIASTLTDHTDPLFSDVAEEGFDMLRAHILRLEQEAEAERHQLSSIKRSDDEFQ